MEAKFRSICWLVALLISALLVINSAFAIIVFLLILILSAAAGFLVESEKVGLSKAAEFHLMQLQSASCSSNNHPVLKLAAKKGNQCFRLDKRISGSSIIDDALQEVLQHVLRDYVENWCSLVTSDVEFLFEVRQALQTMTINISKRCKEVDWIPFLTTKAVDYVAAHIRLYRQARRKWKDKTANSSEVSNSDSSSNLEQIFFELEFSMNRNKMCRKKVCLDSNHEKECLKVIVDFLLQLIGPKNELDCRPVQLLTSQILNSVILIPLLNLMSDPDYINQIIIWMCKDFQITSESFLNVLRYTEHFGELDSAREMLNREIALLRSHDIGGEDDIVIKQRLSSLLYVKKLVDHRLQKMGEGSDSDSIASLQLDWNQLMSVKPNRPLYQLPLHLILKNNVALSYLLDFMSAIGSQAYLFFLLNAEGWKVAAEQQISSMELEGFHVQDEYKSLKKSNSNSAETSPFHQVVSNMQEASMSIYEQYLSEKAAPRLRIDEVVVRRLLYNIKNEPPNESWFDDVQKEVMDKLQKDERFMPSFLKSIGYVRLLAELDLLKDGCKSDDDETKSIDDMSNAETASLYSYDGDNNEKDRRDNSSTAGFVSSSREPPVRNADFVLKASICQKGVVKEGLSSHAVYAVTVTKYLDDKEVSSWIVYRRYSDFNDFHLRMEGKFKGMSRLGFPGKRTFNNMDKLFLERRQYLLNEYLDKLLEPGFLRDNPGLQAALLQFFDRGSYEQSKGVFSRKVDSLMNPFVSSMVSASKSVRWTPMNMFKDNARSDGSSVNDSVRSMSGISFEGSDNVPLRILLFLMDEIFDLQNRNQWLRRRVFYMLREILTKTHGDVFNQRIIDSVAAITSPEQVAEFIRIIKNSFWPNGSPAMPRPARDEATKMRTRVAAKMALLSCVPDEIKHLIGSETTRQGVVRVFDLLQNPILNRRLVYVFVEEIVDTLFPEQNMSEFFQKLHSSAPLK